MCQQVIIVTGGAGFIGSAVIRYLIHETSATVINLDKLTYAANLSNVTEVAGNARYRFERADVCHRTDLERIFREHCPTAVMHLAAESHVDRSIDNPLEFIHTNVVGTATLLEVACSFWSALPPTQRDSFRFHHVSTDEVYGSFGAEGRFTETTPYLPNSPYSASKAGSDHLVRAWHHTYGLPVVVSNCSNNYGPYQFPEKLIPLMILNGLSGKPLPVYGRGDNIRDWLFVEDHARALWTVLTKGQIGECYNIGGNCEARNIEVVESICDLLDEILGPLSLGHSRRNLITFVKDRPGHDARYAIDSTKIAEELSWRPRETFHTGLRRTVEWYIANQKWWRSLRPSVAERRGLSTPANRASPRDEMEICDVGSHLAT